MAAADAAMGKAPPPFEVIEMGLCERFHKFPEDLDEIDWSRLLTGLDAFEVFTTFKKWGENEKLTRDEQGVIEEIAKAKAEKEAIKAEDEIVESEAEEG